MSRNHHPSKYVSKYDSWIIYVRQQKKLYVTVSDQHYEWLCEINLTVLCFKMWLNYAAARWNNISKSLTLTSFFLLQHNRATIACSSLTASENRAESEDKLVPTFFFYLWASLIHNLNSQHACIPSTSLCSLLSPLCLGDLSLDWAPIQGLHFLGDWLWKTNVVIPKCFPCVWRKGRHCWDPGSPARLYVCHAGH